MTLHVNIITPKNIISVSDRLISTPSGYIKEADDQYKHLVLITDDSRVVITFCGFAGIPKEDGTLAESTLEWLKDTLLETSHFGHRLWEDHIKDLKNEAEKRIAKLQSEYKIPLSNLQLVIFIIGEYKGDFLGFLINNCLEKSIKKPGYEWNRVARTLFKTSYKNYSIKNSEKIKIAFLGNEDLAIKQKKLEEELCDYAAKEDVKNIIEISAKIIRAVSKESDGSVGTNYSGVRITKGDPGIQAFDNRENKEYDVMPDVIRSTSKFSGYVGNIRIMNKS